MYRVRNPLRSRGRTITRWTLVLIVLIATTAWVSTKAVQQQNVSVVITGSGIEIQPESVTRGAVRFQVRNNAQVPYKFEIEGSDIELEKKNLQPGSDFTATIDLPAGRYEIEAKSRSGPERKWKVFLMVE